MTNPSSEAQEDLRHDFTELDTLAQETDGTIQILTEIPKGLNFRNAVTALSFSDEVAEISWLEGRVRFFIRPDKQKDPNQERKYAVDFFVDDKNQGWSTQTAQGLRKNAEFYRSIALNSLSPQNPIE